MPFELILPKILDEPSFESFLIQAGPVAQRQKTLILEMGPVETIDPGGMLSLLELGNYLRLRGHRMLLHQPLSADLQQYLERAGFYARARPVYTVYPPYRKSISPSQNWDDDFPLEITPVATREDVARAVERLSKKMERAGGTVVKRLSVLLTDLVEPSGAGGYAVVRSDSSGVAIAISNRAVLRPIPIGEGPGLVETGRPGGLAKVTTIVLPRER
ncbi:MAG: hypothetical protein HY283_03445 [Nitrospirae bacterium]|nr:hypothetical protein [Nitrospirota bacterium]